MGKSIIQQKREIPQSSPLIVQPSLSDNAIMKEIQLADGDWTKALKPRLDEDEKLWTGEPYELKDSKGDKLQDVEHVTLNDARVFGERVLAVLNESEEIIEINGQRSGRVMDSKQTKVIEDFFHDVLYIADERQDGILMPGIDPYFWEQIGIRGGVFSRILLSQDGEGFDPDILPLDRYKCRFRMGRRGFSWFAFWDVLSRDECLDEYPDYAMKGETVIRWDYWNSTEEIIFLDGTFYDAYPNKLGYPPFIGQLCQQGTFLETSARALRMRGDSIYSANRDLYPHLNKIASIMQTMNMLSLAPPQVLKSKSGKKLPSEPIYRLGRILALETDEGLQKVDAPDIIGAMRFFQGMLGGALQRGSLSHIDWGNLQFQLSQVAIATLAGASRQVFTPRLHTMERFKRKMAKEIISQFTNFNMKADIGRVGKKRTYTKADLEGSYSIDFEYLTALPEEIANAYGLADMAKGWMDDRSIRKVILKYRDYDDMSEKVLVQQAQRVSQALSLFQMAQSLDNQGEEEQARILLIEMGRALAGETGKAVSEATGVSVPQAESVLPAEVPEAIRTGRKQERPGTGELEEVTGGI